MGRCSPSSERIPHRPCQRLKVEKVLTHRQPGAVVARRVDEQGGQRREMLGADLDRVDPAPLALAEFGRRQ